MSRARQFGPLVTEAGVTFRLWAPGARTVSLVIGQPSAMAARGNGWFEFLMPDARRGTTYKFCIDDQIEVPDPASHFQPHDVHGPSEVIDHHFAWRASEWKGRPWQDCVFSELHVGTFTRAGTFLGVIDKLDHLAGAGFTAVELMPLADFFGRWNWGYDGVLPFAPDSAYGRPEDLKTLIDAAHLRGLMVFLDVVYNHFGPEGNYLGRYAPSFFTEAQTPWGSAIDYRVPQVRTFVIENALHWLTNYRFDGLRLDAVHAIVQPGEPSVLTELSDAVGELAAATGRHIHLVLENDDNTARLLDPLEDPPRGRYRAQWNDDYHHAAHVLLTKESAGYYRDYNEPGRRLARCLAQGFAYQGEASAHRNGVRRGESTAHLPVTAFVNFLQNHDQIGNRARGERLSELADAKAIKALLAVTLLSPGPPLMFMGEEWGAREPFPFFCDFTGELAEAVRQGRRKEFAEAYAEAAADIPDPLAEETVRRATLDWDAVGKPPHRGRLDLVKRLLDVRKTAVGPLLADLLPGQAEANYQDGILTAKWPCRSGKTLRLVGNLSDGDRPLPEHALRGANIWGGAPARRLLPWSVHVSLDGM
jgi:maltooligosyltrehalose trehalohydrolase